MTDDEIISVVKAHKEGKKIEYSWGTKINWHKFPSDSTRWDFDQYEYRISPELRKPRDFWIHLPSGQVCGSWIAGGDYIHVREVIE